MFKNLSGKIVGSIAITLVLTSGISFWITQRRVDQQAEESADGARQSAKACEDLSSLALDMQKLVGNFRVEDNGRGSQGHRRFRQTQFKPANFTKEEGLRRRYTMTAVRARE